uniref:Non-specific lipid-transfer protein AP10 n=1 Tax=Cajanus cajan TaxID=3821 RepID=A0A151T7E6_CAJCA|nr:Non-specific lipid-transfer protein AP10 [Cajanus cajan]
MGEKKMATLYMCMMSFGLLTSMVSGFQREEITCNEALTYLLPCEPFMLNLGPLEPSSQCCGGLVAIFLKTKKLGVRRSMCQCIKKSTLEAGIKHERAQLLPQFCKIHFAFPITPNANCSS